MIEKERPWWETSKQAECIGIRLASTSRCLVHANEKERTAALSLVGETGTIDARGVMITDDLLERILAAVPRRENGEPLIKYCQFQGATFIGDASFDGVAFSDSAWFNGATFNRAASFERATFSDEAIFHHVTFSGDANFDNATFAAKATFHRTTFREGPTFIAATFGDDALFYEATFNGAAFLDTTFGGDTSFSNATFRGETTFDKAAFIGNASFHGTTFRGVAEFPKVRFEQARQFGPILAFRGLVLDEAQFMQPVQIEIGSTVVWCRRARFPGGVKFQLRWAYVVLDDADLPGPSILAGIPRLSNEKLIQQEDQIARAWQRFLQRDISDLPHLVSLRRANVAGLSLSNISATDCHFVGAYNLDKLRLESGVSFAFAPMPGRWGRGTWGGREVIAEECAWRASTSRHRWVVPRWPSWLDKRPDVLEPEQIAGLYRALRKGREDIKDEPGAADFYYGEMEMRRARPLSNSYRSNQAKATSRGRVERGILTAYWLVSGYGSRAWRAAAWLAVVTSLLAVAFHFVGFAVPPRPVSYWTSLLYAFRSTLSITDNEVKLTAWGELLQVLLRLVGPVLLGLALLAVRGRVKR